MNTNLLMVDDDEEICEEMSEILQDEGYNVTVAYNGLDAKELLLKNHYDIVLLDLKIPGLNGYDILRLIKEHNIRSKVLLLTGRPFIRKYLPGEDEINKQKKEDILKLADGFINKPFDVVVVLDTIKKLLSV